MRGRRPRPAHGTIRERFRTLRTARRADPHHRIRHHRATAIPQRATHSRKTARLGRGANHQRKRLARIQRNPIRRQRPPLRIDRQHRCRRRPRTPHRRGCALHGTPKRTRIETHQLRAERGRRARQRAGRRHRIKCGHRRHGHQNGSSPRGGSFRHSRSAHLRVERRPGHDGRPGRHRIRTNQRPWLFAPPMDWLRGPPARYSGGRRGRIQRGAWGSGQSARSRSARSEGRFRRRRRGVDRQRNGRASRKRPSRIRLRRDSANARP